MKKLICIFLFSLYVCFSYSQTQECFSIKCTYAKIEEGNLVAWFSLVNNTDSSMYLIKGGEFDVYSTLGYNLKMQDSLGNNIEFYGCIASRITRKRDYVRLEQGKSLGVKFVIKLKEYSIGFKGGKEDKEFVFPLKIRLKYNCAGYYFTKNQTDFEFNNSRVFLSNATFQCESEEIKVYK